MNYHRHFRAARSVSDFGAATPSIQSVQHALNLAGASPQLAEDGAFGPLSIAALRTFQSVHGLTVDGKLGPQSYTALGLMGAPAAAPVPTTAGPIPSTPMGVPMPPAPPTFAAPALLPTLGDPLSSLSTGQKMAILLGSVALIGTGVAIMTGGKKGRK